MQPNNLHTGFRTILAYTTPHRRVLLLISGLLALGSLLALIPPVLAGLLTEGILKPSEALLSVPLVLGAWLFVMMANSALGYYSDYVLGVTNLEINANLQSRLYQHLQALTLGYHQQGRRGDTLALLHNDAERVSNFVTDALIQVLPALLTCVVAFILMLRIEPRLTALIVILLPLYMLALKLSSRQLRPLSRQVMDAQSEVYTVSEENLGMLPVIKAFTREQLEQQRFDTAIGRVVAVSRKHLLVYNMLSPLSSLFGGVALILLIWLGAGKISAGTLTPAELVSLIFFSMVLLGPVSTLAQLYGQVQSTRGATERIIAFLSAQPEPEDDGLVTLKNTSGAIEFRDIHFTYPGRPKVLMGLNLDIAAGETVAITGENGAGKSTLVHLLMRFIDPNTGTVFLDGQDTREASLSSLRHQIGLVSQRVLLLNGTVIDNIRYGLPTASKEEAVTAANAARAHHFISDLPQGYDTVIGDQGIRLSGGQCQRIALARALLKNPPILVLDEATAMFDPAAEQEFIAQCHEVLTQRTVIIITHRPASLALADRVLRLHDGRLEI